MTQHVHVPRLPFAPDPLIGEARRRARQRRLIVAVAVTLIVGGAAALTVTLRSPGSSPGLVVTGISSPAPAATSDCGRSVSGQGFHVFACMSGGASTGHAHPKELLVVREDGSSVAYPAFRVGEFAVGDGEVVATYDLNLARVTRSRLVSLVTIHELAKALHVRSTAIMDIYDPRVDAHGDIYFVASVLRRGRLGCQNPLLERTSAGTIHQIRGSSASRSSICA